jgi:hypothetical protein
MTRQEPAKEHKTRKLLVVLFLLIFLGALALDLWILLSVAQAAWYVKVEVISAILGFYAFVFGFLTATGVLKQLTDMTEEMSSPNLFRFLRGNFFFLSIVFATLGIALNPQKSRLGCWANLLSGMVLIPALPAVMMYALFHVVVIVPLAYVPYLIASAFIMSIETCVDDVEFTYGPQRIRIKELVSANVVPLRNFIVAVPATVFSTVLTMASSFGS